MKHRDLIKRLENNGWWKLCEVQIMIFIQMEKRMNQFLVTQKLMNCLQNK